MNLRRWLLLNATLGALAAAVTLTLGLCCIFGVIGGQCELWLLGPLVAAPLGIGLGLIGRAIGNLPDQEPLTPELAPDQSTGCAEREQT